MAAVCTICTNQAIESINHALEEGKSKRVVAKLFGVSESAIHRHRTHLRENAGKPRPRSKKTDEPTSLAEISRLETETLRILESSPVEKTRLDAIARLQSLHNDRMRYQQETTGATSLVADCAFQEVVAAITTALLPYDEAREAVSAALDAVIGAPMTKPVCAKCGGDIAPTTTDGGAPS